MSYLVLARKYRPGNFEDIVGQEHVVRTLQNAINMERVHHAFLFCGARGIGKTTTARVLARALNCEQGTSGMPCGTCSNCKEIAASTNPDVLEIDGASNRGVDNVRELRETVRYAPSRSRHKIYIIDEVHQLTSEAFNALLKTLEEPPSHVKFIFATTEPHKIPATILSRCQRFDFRRVSVSVLSDHVRTILSKENMDLSATAVSAIVREAQGSVRDALSLLDQVLSYSGDKPDDGQVIEALGIIEREIIFDVCDAILKRDAASMLSLVAQVDARGQDLSDMANLLVEHFRDMTVVKWVEKPSEALLDRSPGEIAKLADQVRNVSLPDLHRMFGVLVEAAEDVSRSPYPRVSLEMGLLRLFEIESTDNLSGLLKKLDALAKQTGDNQGQFAHSAKALAKDQKDSKNRVGTKPPDTTWQSFVEQSRTRHPALAAILEHARPISFDSTQVSLGYASGTFYAEAMRDKQNRLLLEQLLVQHFGKAPKLVLSATDSKETPVATLAETIEQNQAKHDKNVQESAKNHPAVQDAVRILGGTIKTIVPLGQQEEDML